MLRINDGWGLSPKQEIYTICVGLKNHFIEGDRETVKSVELEDGSKIRSSKQDTENHGNHEWQ